MIDSCGLMEFFLTYRTVTVPLELCKLLGSITIEGRVLQVDASEEPERSVAQPFFKNEELKKELLNWLESLSAKFKRLQKESIE
ncbi:hypothetical protein PPACK8108_LOCUS2485 [Phakopsora pachyrhizi]|uniref:Uncharacterized protein n=1 Tax=Phakopsora pachyrhizi TaxID=170000 RepID=A0AAV0AK99_PHAPC|nr:hypothetical protein PPACK8108_LOCUS2485 [Phakopsora pachyrhizi]